MSHESDLWEAVWEQQAMTWRPPGPPRASASEIVMRLTTAFGESVETLRGSVETLRGMTDTYMELGRWLRDRVPPPASTKSPPFWTVNPTRDRPTRAR